MMVVMTVVIMAVIVMGVRRMGTMTMAVIVMLDGIAARVARMRPKDSAQPRENRADQRQKDDCLDHVVALLRMIFSENRFTLFRIMP